jgi:hypothetical protein
MRKTTFPEGDASNNQLARYLYYTGRIKAVQLEYTDAFRCLQQASRKAPQQSALGFRKTVYKFSTIVQLLLGEIPDRSIFSQKVFLHLHWCWFANPNFSAGDDCSFEAISPHRSGCADFPRYDDKNALFDVRFEQAVRVGDLGAFHEAMATFSDGFKTDKTCDS